MFDAVGVYGSLTLGVVVVTMTTSCIIMSVLIWYLDNVWPWQDGVPKKPWFLFTANYWFPNSTYTLKVDTNDMVEAKNKKYFERPLSGIARVITLKGVRKKFGRKVAVDGIDMEILYGQITCLLGHNGAGKTTTMNMITGMFTADDGQIRVNGYDINMHTKEARQSMSHCPQVCGTTPSNNSVTVA